MLTIRFQGSQMDALLWGAAGILTIIFLVMVAPWKKEREHSKSVFCPKCGKDNDSGHLWCANCDKLEVQLRSRKNEDGKRAYFFRCAHCLAESDGQRRLALCYQCGCDVGPRLLNARWWRI
jgi:hypothetical protein